MSIQLRLDVPALQALFPEGSEARLDLQRAVVSQFITQYLKPSMIRDDVMRMVTAARAEAVAQVMREMGAQSTWGAGISDSFKLQLKNEIATQASSFVSNEINEALMRSMTARVKNIEATVENALERMTANMLRARLEEKIRAL